MALESRLMSFNELGQSLRDISSKKINSNISTIFSTY
jgi:hypothetical protein